MEQELANDGPKLTYDAAVVGGSLAGAATAIHLAEAGRSVVLLERSRAFRRKACGEGLFPQGVRELERLGLLSAVREHSAEIHGVRFHADDAVATAAVGGRGGIGVRRERLDPLILARAEAAGVEVRRGATVRALLHDGRRLCGLTTNDGDVCARVVVGADGLNSRMRSLAGLGGKRRGSRFGISAHVRLSGTLEPFVDVHFNRGYELYVTPVGSAEANVALLLQKSAMHQFAGKLQARYEQVLRASGVLGDSFELLDEPLPAGPFAASCTRPWRANLVLTGDAAGFFDGITGEGMSIALVSARACAQAAHRYLSSGDYEPFREYAARRTVLVRNSNLLGRVSLTLGSRPWLARLAVRNLQRQPETFEKLVAINNGEANLRALHPRDLVALATGR
jgi:flavin-dependent dehydrogenase